MIGPTAAWYALLVVGRLIDFWDFCDPRAIRLRLLLVGLVAFAALARGWGHAAFPFALSGTTLQPGVLVVPVYPLPARRLRFGVYWPILD